MCSRWMIEVDATRCISTFKHDGIGVASNMLQSLDATLKSGFTNHQILPGAQNRAGGGCEKYKYTATDNL